MSNINHCNRFFPSPQSAIMKVLLAGFNVDIEVLKAYKNKTRTLTPESLSAAYARISRSPKAVDALRSEARKEVEKARKSNRTIIFEMGHHSIAEHAVFNFDIIGISRRAVEELEKFRLCSYTEKSQRYVTLKGDFFIPEELKETDVFNDYLNIIRAQNNFYKILFNKIKKYASKRYPHLTKSKKGQHALENISKEDARYILSLATQTQLGATINARNLELMMRRFASHRLSELNRLGKKFFTLVKKIAPSIILFYEANDYDEKTYPALQQHTQDLLRKTNAAQDIKDVMLIDYTPNADNKILASLMFKVSQKPYTQCLKTVKHMSKKAKIAFFKKACRYLELYDVVLREFEFGNVTYALTVSAACFGQLKRHRIATLTWQDYDPNLGITIPEAIKEIGEDKTFAHIVDRTERIYNKIEKRHPGLGTYVLTNAHRKRVLVNMNLRELYHLSRLREDVTAQWDIRDKAHKMSKAAKKAMPITAQLLGSKSEYPKLYFRLFGQHPKITQVPPPEGLC